LLILLLILPGSCAPSLPNPLALDPATAQTAIEEQLHMGAATAPITNVMVRRTGATLVNVLWVSAIFVRTYPLRMF